MLHIAHDQNLCNGWRVAAQLSNAYVGSAVSIERLSYLR
jgi:hypothetical protein